MHLRTHLLIAMFFGYLYFQTGPAFTILQKFVFSSFLVGTCLLPDIDTPNSSIGKRHKLISKFTKHRGLFHSIWIPLFSLLLSEVVPFFKPHLMGIFVGYGSHLLGDMITVRGIKPLAPIYNKKIRGPFITGSIFETMISAAIVMFFLVGPSIPL